MSAILDFYDVYLFETYIKLVSCFGSFGHLLCSGVGRGGGRGGVG